MSVDPGGGQRLEACHHHQTGPNTPQSLLYTVDVVGLLFIIFIFFYYYLISYNGPVPTCNCTVESLNTAFLYCVDPVEYSTYCSVTRGLLTVFSDPAGYPGAAERAQHSRPSTSRGLHNLLVS